MNRLRKVCDNGILVEHDDGTVWLYEMSQEQLDDLRKKMYEAQKAAMEEAGVEVTELKRESVMRPSFQDIYLRLAVMMSERSTCERMKVGAVITSIDSRYVYAVSYNGSAAGDKNGCDRHGQDAVGNCGCIHAEANAVVNCRASREKAKVVFCSHLPCVSCAKLLINLGGVQRVVYRNDYRIKDSLEWFERASIKAVHMPEKSA